MATTKPRFRSDNPQEQIAFYYFTKSTDSHTPSSSANYKLVLYIIVNYFCSEHRYIRNQRNSIVSRIRTILYKVNMGFLFISEIVINSYLKIIELNVTLVKWKNIENTVVGCCQNVKPNQNSWYEIWIIRVIFVIMLCELGYLCCVYPVRWVVFTPFTYSFHISNDWLS